MLVPQEIKPGPAPQTVVIVTFDTDLGITYGSHTAVFLTNTSDGGDLYDPAGSFGGQSRPSGGLFNVLDDGVSLSSYIAYQQQTGSTVHQFVFNTTQAEEDQIEHDAMSIGDPRGFSCAKSVSAAISGVGPFQAITQTGVPGSLAEQLEQLQTAIALEHLALGIAHIIF
ncbi:MAG TPA: hypothetical protein VGV15_11870 [Terriglobales bacterium]|nr:hypothetical protein [Terriglobales bacterium]